MSRFVIRSASGLLHSGNFVPETVYVPIPGNPTQAQPRAMLEPQFDTKNVLQALKYAEPSDANAMLSHPDLVDPKAFDGCQLCEVEFDPDNPQAIRPVA